jgi:3-phenylpropionate/trans-cinnamate dioxygenase ferredoxin subunit
MGTFTKAANINELKDGEKKKVTLGGAEIMLARVGGSYYALANKCPHMGGNLSAGKLEGTVITCPLHASQFDVRDGHSVRWTAWSGVKLAAVKIFRSPRPARTYSVKVEGEDIMVEV